MEKKLQKVYFTDYNLLIAQDLRQAHYQILSIIFLKELIKLNVNMDIMIKSVRLLKLYINIATAFLNTQTLKMIQSNTNFYVVTKIIDKSLMET